MDKNDENFTKIGSENDENYRDVMSSFLTEEINTNNSMNMDITDNNGSIQNIENGNENGNGCVILNSKLSESNITNENKLNNLNKNLKNSLKRTSNQRLWKINADLFSRQIRESTNNLQTEIIGDGKLINNDVEIKCEKKKISVKNEINEKNESIGIISETVTVTEVFEEKNVPNGKKNVLEKNILDEKNVLLGMNSKLVTVENNFVSVPISILSDENGNRNGNGNYSGNNSGEINTVTLPVINEINDNGNENGDNINSNNIANNGDNNEIENIAVKMLTENDNVDAVKITEMPPIPCATPSINHNTKVKIKDEKQTQITQIPTIEAKNILFDSKNLRNVLSDPEFFLEEWTKACYEEGCALEKEEAIIRR